MPKNSVLTRVDTFQYWTGERVRWSDTDLVGHVNNLSFNIYFETGRTEFLRPLLMAEYGERVMMLLVQMTVNYFGELHWPGEPRIGTGLLEVGRSSCRLGQGLFDGERCIGSAETVLVHIDEQARQARELPQIARDFFQPFIIGASDVPLSSGVERG